MTAPHITKIAPRIVSHTGTKCTASVILLHGSGGTGNDFRSTLRFVLRANKDCPDMTFPHIRILYPTAPIRPYTLADGALRNVWFDRKSLGLEGDDDQESVDAMATQLQQLVDSEVQSGIPLKRIVIGGFSMGGSMALHLGYRFLPEVAGVACLSSFLNGQSAVYKAIDERPKDSLLPPLLHIHGEADDIVMFNWGKDTFSQLQSQGVRGEFLPVQSLGHAISKHVVTHLREWILKVLPE